MNLPSAFEEKMKYLLGAEYSDYLGCFDEPRHYGLRINTAKISVEDFLKISPWPLKKVPWIHNGFYYDGEKYQPAKHPYYFAGLYYLQEPSAMTPADRLPIEPGDKVLDVCAAPGGKATELGARLNGTGVLAANDLSNSRAKGLLKNIEADNDLAMNFVPDHHKHLITAKGVSLAYDKLPLFQPTTFDLMRGHQIVITGKNGIGKSSLFNAITNTFAGTITGKLHSADKISISYLSQIEQSNNLSLKDFAQKHHLNYADFLNILHKLGTERDIFTNSINQMSSGQQKKVYLAKSLLEPANLYLWDEPLNYLDVFNQEQIIQLIKKYHPTMLVIEHDQRFIDELGAQVIHLT